MTLKYLLDTNVISEPIRAQPNANVVRCLKFHRTELAIPSVVWHELLFGRERLPQSAKRSAIEAYLNGIIPSLTILPYDERAAEWHAIERARLSALGKTPPFVDGQIASIAQTNNLILVTHNTNDFATAAGIQIEDWHQ